MYDVIYDNTPAEVFSPVQEPVVEYKNNPTVVCVLLPRRDDKLILIRRGLKDGYGKLALPGGFQNHGENMRKAAVREVLEETGIEIDESALLLVSGDTDEYGHNVLIFLHMREIEVDQVFAPRNDGEILAVVPVSAAVETAYPMHTEAVARYFQGAA
jgi:ADP-ribose pyrophosphatase YjhB (NUDIX family)